jgi:hypothetical protein
MFKFGKAALLIGFILPVSFARPAMSAETANPDIDTSASDSIGEVIVTGTRETGRKASDSATPIEVISGETLQAT